MSHKRTLWGILLLLLLISSPSLVESWNAEESNQTYEIVAPYEEIESLTANGSLSTHEVFSMLKEVGLTTVSLNPITINTLEKRDIINIYQGENINDIYRFTNSMSPSVDENGLYITVPENNYYKELLMNQLNPEEVTVGNNPLLFIPENRNINSLTGLGYDELVIKELKRYGLSYILRVPNDQENIENNQLLVQSLVALEEDMKPKLLFSGESIIGYPHTKKMNRWIKLLDESGFQFYFIEFAKQHGFQLLAHSTDYNVIRLHSLNLGVKSTEESIHQAVRAVKERNIRSIFFHFESGDPKNSLKQSIHFITGINENMPSKFQLGDPGPFKEVKVPKWITITSLIAAILFTYVIFCISQSKWIPFIVSAFVFLFSITYILFDKLIFLQLIALFIAIITPSYAVLSTSTIYSKNINEVTLKYLQAIGICVIGITIIISLLNGNAFLLGLEVFRGVKLVYICPIVFMVIFLVWKEKMYKNAISVLNKEVKYWHLLVLITLGIIGLYYISRTGNGAVVTNLELMIRNTLEQLLYVRPRTKEFLIGFPFFLLALYVKKEHKIFGHILLLPGVIGFLSIINTFTHFHIPLSISIVRTLYGIAFGYVIGIILIFLYRPFYPWISNLIKKRKRWS